MTLTNTSLTPIGRLDNTSDRIASLRIYAAAMADRTDRSPELDDDLTTVGSLLDKLERDLNEAIGRVHTLARYGDEIGPLPKQIVHDLTLAQEQWLNYAAARLETANIAYLALDRAA